MAKKLVRLSACIAALLCALPGTRMDGSARPRILVLCTGNSARSQMAAGFLKSLDGRLELFSAGTAPAPRINPNAVRVMKEVGIDISDGVPKNVDRKSTRLNSSHL